jgi:hypothetical protein
MAAVNNGNADLTDLLKVDDYFDVDPPIAAATARTRSITREETPTSEIDSSDFIDIEQPERGYDERVVDAETLSAEPTPRWKCDPIQVVEKQQLPDNVNEYPEEFSDRPDVYKVFEYEISITTNFKSKRLRAYKMPDKFLETVKDSGLTLSLKKCSAAQSKVTFVGQVVGSGLLEPDPIKIATISSLRPPVTKREVRRLTGFFSYFESCIPSLAETTRIIADTTRKDETNEDPWRTEHQKILDELNDDLCKYSCRFCVQKLRGKPSHNRGFDSVDS